ncbi:MAG: efflux RND transporter periplasmic adaptor subunit [Verrucomicrobiota bacterium]
MAVLCVAGLVWLVKYRQAEAAAKTSARGRADMAIPVTAGRVTRKDVPIYLDGLGTAQAYNTVTVKTRVDGQLVRVAFTEGQDVHPGDLLAQIDPRPFKAALEQAQAKKKQDEAQLANAKVDLQRDQDLVKDKIVTEQALATQQSLVDQLEGTVQADQAGIDSAQVQLDYTTISSPLEGRCGVRLVDQGNIVHATDTNGLVVITQLRPIFVVFTLPEQDVGIISRQMAQGPVTVLALDHDNKTVLDTGTVAVMDNQIDTTTGTIKLKAAFPNQDLRLCPGQFVNPRVLVEKTNGLVVPENVIQRGPEGEYVFTIVGQGSNLTVKLTPVTVGRMQDDWALVAKGLTNGQEVVVDGQYRLEDGSKVNVQDAEHPAGSAGDLGHGTRRGSGGGTNHPPANHPPKESGA